jgi:hypothetical protein
LTHDDSLLHGVFLPEFIVFDAGTKNLSDTADLFMGIEVLAFRQWERCQKTSKRSKASSQAVCREARKAASSMIRTIWSSRSFHTRPMSVGALGVAAQQQDDVGPQHALGAQPHQGAPAAEVAVDVGEVEHGRDHGGVDRGDVPVLARRGREGGS